MGMRTASGRSSSSRCARPRFAPARSSACRPQSRSKKEAPRCSSFQAPPAGFPRGGWGLGMGVVARSGSRKCHETVEIELQLIGASLRSVADEMGAVLIRSAFSANIKERRDCSTALFDASGSMIAQAEHIPVHLGAMPDAVAAVREQDPVPDDVYILNDPFTEGTHLPDITLVTRTPVGFAVTRAHHADVGAREPGSLPADSRRLDEEGVVIPPTRLDDAVLDALVARMRNPDERRGDLRAQLAAHALAGRRLEELCERRGTQRVEDASDELYRYSERIVRAAIAELPDGRFEATDLLEPPGGGELEITAAVTIAGDELEIDFERTAPQHDSNLNCPLAVTRSACYFVVRCLTSPDVPASGGAFAPVHVQAPEGCLVNARPRAEAGAGGAAMVSSGNCGCSNRAAFRSSASADARLRKARMEASQEGPGATSSTGQSSRRRSRATSSTATSFGSRRPAAAASDASETATRHGAQAAVGPAASRCSTFVTVS